MEEAREELQGQKSQIKKQLPPRVVVVRGGTHGARVRLSAVPHDSDTSMRMSFVLTPIRVTDSYLNDTQKPHGPEGGAYLLSPQGFTVGGGGLEVELTSRLGMMDVSIRDVETQSVTDISTIEISH